MKKFIKNTIFPRVIFIPYFFVRIIIEIINLFNFYLFQIHKNRKTKLCIESGSKGWDLIEYKEILDSGREYLGHNNVIKLVVNKNSSYILQIIKNIMYYKPTHFLYDSRTGSQNFILGFFFNPLQFQYYFQVYGVVPICTLTDLPVRKWRLQTAVVTCKRGIVVTLMSPKNISSIFPHNRLVGPMTMPFSLKTLNNIKNIQNKSAKYKQKDIVFCWITL